MDALIEFFGEDIFSEQLEGNSGGTSRSGSTPVEEPDFTNVKPGFLLPTIKLGQAVFTVHAPDNVVVSSPKSKQSTWTVQELLVIFGYMLSPQCKKDMVRDEKGKKKGVGSHCRQSYRQTFGNLYVKWVRISQRWFLQVDRYTLKDLDGVPSCRARFNKTVLSYLKRQDVSTLCQKVGSCGKSLLPSEFWNQALNGVVEIMHKRPGKDFSTKQRNLLRKPESVAGFLLQLLACFCNDYDLTDAPSVTDLLGDERLELWYTLSQASG